MDGADFRAKLKADLDRISAELIQDHLGRCHKSIQSLLLSTNTLTDSRHKASILALCAYPTSSALTLVHSLLCEIAIKLFV